MIYWFDVLALHLRDLFSNPVQSKVTKDPCSPRARGGYHCQEFMGSACNEMFVGTGMLEGLTPKPAQSWKVRHFP